MAVSWNRGTKLHGKISQKTSGLKYPALGGYCNCYFLQFVGEAHVGRNSRDFMFRGQWL